MNKRTTYAIRKLNDADISHTLHNNDTHIKINDSIHFYPTTGTFVINKRTYEPEFTREFKSVKNQIKKLIRMMRNETDNLDAPNYWSTGLYVPYSVEFHFPNGTVEFVKTEVRS